MPKTKAWLLAIITSLLVYAPALSASGIDSEKAVEQPNNVKKQQSSMALDDYFVVDQESRTPEGSAYAACEIFERHGDVYTSTKRSIPASLVDQIKICALESEKFQTPNLKDVGVTPEALRAKVEALLKRGELPSSNPQKYPHPTFEQLDPKVREMYEFESVWLCRAGSACVRASHNDLPLA